MNLWKIEKIKSITPPRTHDLWKKIINWKRELHSNHLATEVAWKKKSFSLFESPAQLAQSELSLGSVWSANKSSLFLPHNAQCLFLLWFLHQMKS